MTRCLLSIGRILAMYNRAMRPATEDVDSELESLTGSDQPRMRFKLSAADQKQRYRNNRESAISYAWMFMIGGALICAVFTIIGWSIYEYVKLHPLVRVFASARSFESFSNFVSGAFVVLCVFNAVMSVALLATLGLCESLGPMCLIWLLFFCIPLLVPSESGRLAHAISWERRCSGAGLAVLLQGRAFRESQSAPNAAYFYSDDGLLFSYVLDANTDTLSTGSTTYKLGFEKYFAAPHDVPAAFVPTLSEVYYDERNNTFTGTCSAPNGGVGVGCVAGSILSDGLVLRDGNATATSAASHELRFASRGWQFTNEAPALAVRSVDKNGHLGGVVLETVLEHPNDCSRLKVCLPRGTVDRDVLVPLGILLHRHAANTQICTGPKF